MDIFMLFKGGVYKKYPKHWLKVSPWENGEDRHLAYSEVDRLINEKRAKLIDKQNAYRIINKLFKTFTTDWFHNGHLYKIMKDDSIDNALKHSFVEVDDNGECLCTIEYQLCWYQGNIYWITYQNIPNKINLYKFENISKAPGSYVKNTNKKFLKPIYKLCFNKKTHKEYWQIL